MTIQNIIAEAKKLSRAQRADLIEELILIDVDDLALTPAQAADLERRLDELDAGEATLIPGDLAMEQLRRREDD